MSASVLVVRGFLKANPSITDQPVLHSMARNKLKVEGYLTWPYTEKAKVAGAYKYSCDIPDLGKLFMNVDIRIPVWKPKTHRDVAAVLFKKYGVAVNVDDIEPIAMSYDPLPPTVTLKALPTAATVVGSVVVGIYQEPKDISEIITVTDVVGIVDKYPLTNPLMVLEKRYYGYDFTEQRDTLKTVASLGPILNVQSVYDEMNGPTWGAAWDRPLAYNLYNASLVYLGPTTGYPEANPAYTHCAVYKPGGMSSGTVTGSSMILHFNQ